MILIVIAAALFLYFQFYNNNYKKDIITPKRNETNTEQYYIKNFPKNKYKYLPENPELTAILTDLKFTRMFDKARYEDLELLMDKYQKVYIYILAGRYNRRSYIDTWIDLRQNILEILYGLVFVVPDQLKHTYGINTHEVIDNNRKRFDVLGKRMTQTLENFMKDGRGEFYFPENGPRPYEPGNQDRLP